METRLFRLTMLIALVSFLGFFARAIYYQYQYDGWTELLANYSTYAKESFEHCGDLPTPAFIRTGRCPIQQEKIDKPSEMPRRSMAKLRESAWAAGIAPVGALFIFYLGRWVIVVASSRRTWRRGPLGAENLTVILKTHAAIELIAMMENMTPGTFDHVEQIHDIRRQIEVAVADGAITIPESRMLLKEASRLEEGLDLAG
jgi:hypothetical protein